MGAIDRTLRVPFASVNLPNDPRYREGWVRHHLHPQQGMRDAGLAPFLRAMRDEGYDIDDFETNGLMLPTLSSQSRASGRPVHRGGHPRYNARVIDELNAIRLFCESIRSESQRRRVALAGLRGSQRRVRSAMLNQHAVHVDHVNLSGRSDGDLDRIIDQLLASKAH